MLHEDFKVLGHDFNELMEHPELYARLTGLTAEPNEVCFLYNDEKVIMQGHYIRQMSDIATRFRTTLEDVGKFVCSAKSLYELSESLSWRVMDVGNMVCYTLNMFKRGTVGDNFIEWLRGGHTVEDIISEYFKVATEGTPAARKLQRFDSAASDIVGSISMEFEKYAETSARDWLFDYITVRVSLIGISDMSRPDRIKMVHKCIGFIDAKVLDEIAKNKHFRGAGLSTNFLKCDNRTLTADCTLMYKFSWKIENGGNI